jgi:hypothetical protein
MAGFITVRVSPESNRATAQPRNSAGDPFAVTCLLPPQPDSPPRLPRLFRHRSGLESHGDGFVGHSSIFDNRSSMLKSRCSNPVSGSSRRDRSSSGLKCYRSGLVNRSSILHASPRTRPTVPLASKTAPRNDTALSRLQNLLRRFLLHRARFLICCYRAVCS